MLEFVFICHLLYTWPTCYVPLMDESVEELCARFNGLRIVTEVSPTLPCGRGGIAASSSVCDSFTVLAAHDCIASLVFIKLLRVLLFLFCVQATNVVVGILFGLHIQDRLQRFLVIWYLVLQPGQVEIVFDEFFRDLCEVFVTKKCAEGRYPGLWSARVGCGHCAGRGGAVPRGASKGVCRAGGSQTDIVELGKEGGVQRETVAGA